MKPKPPASSAAPRVQDEVHLRILRQIRATPDVTQRELADQLGISLGKVNFVVQGLIGKGWIKARNFRNSQNKWSYLYQLTPAGLEHKAQITLRYMQRRMAEYEALKVEIRELQQDLDAPVAELAESRKDL